jgi:uncharacterized membrane protein YwzB
MKVNFIIYLISTIVSTFAVSGINFDYIIKKNHIWEARFLSIITILSLAYLISNFFISLLNINII